MMTSPNWKLWPLLFRFPGPCPASRHEAVTENFGHIGIVNPILTIIGLKVRSLQYLDGVPESYLTWLGCEKIQRKTCFLPSRSRGKHSQKPANSSNCPYTYDITNCRWPWLSLIYHQPLTSTLLPRPIGVFVSVHFRGQTGIIIIAVYRCFIKT